MVTTLSKSMKANLLRFAYYSVYLVNARKYISAYLTLLNNRDVI